MEQSLLRSLHDLHIRSQVEDTLKEMITDVELAHALQEELSARTKIDQLQRKIAQQEYMWEEAKVVEEERRSEELEVADKLVLELWALSRELGELQAIKVQHKELLMQHDEVVAKLIQTEEELAEIKLNAFEQPRKESADICDKSPSIETQQESPGETRNEVKAPEEKKSDKQEKTVDDETLPAVEPGVLPAVVALDDEKPDVPKLEEFEATILMHIFAYMDALDILNTAQVNISMYSRVDSLFGLGHSDDATNSSKVAPDKTSSTATSPSSQPSTKPATAATSNEASTATSKAVSTSVNGPTVVKVPSASSPSAANVDAPAPSGVSKQPTSSSGATQPISPAVSSASAATPIKPAMSAAASASSDASGSLSPTRGGLALFSSILQPRNKPYAVGPAGSAMTAAPGSRAAQAAMQLHHRRSASADSSNQRQHPEQQPMNAAMANSMAAKLSDAELNAIILMTDRLKQKENLADRLLKENDQLMAKLEGVEAVKDFLIAKVRDMEQAISSSEDNDAKVAQQIASDQEVIAFLDARVQELEAETRRVEAEKQAAIDEKNQIKTQMGKKVEVLEDMLQFERERLNENEVEWKATKKLLVKEVKSLRAQIVALLAERDGFREQNEHLRKAVVSSSPSRTSMIREMSYP